MHSTTIGLEPASLSDEQVSHLFPLVFTELREAHQRIIEEASDERYKACPPIPDSVQSFTDLARKRIDRQQSEYGGEPENRPDYLRTAYLKRENSYSELQIAIEDVVVS
ncbi:hypothetical protein M0R88_18475 [Halorussus gelatinilyticus]|uniref:Uncharacterized protein n=1 Tax=Halorussus gelatinilyticus TaxID=2937524 RepID=A0A8U0IJP6_9EURY|nr:hypothetical protein [Halorussus gelatinilyticus]UPW00474.1 hypothetical protein M0R88_18475 [Halorussus gelatinilyticus]